MKGWILAASIAAAAVIAFGGVGINAKAQPARPRADHPQRSPAFADPLVAGRSRWDANHDGVNTCEEWTFFISRLFGLANRNGDRFLNTKEFARLGKIEPIFADADFSYFDVDHDARISRKEFLERPSPFFVRFDRNADCRVTAEEITVIGSSAPRGRPRPPRGGRGGGALR